MPSDVKQTRTSIPDLLNGNCIHGRMCSNDNGPDWYMSASECDDCIQLVLKELSDLQSKVRELTERELRVLTRKELNE